MRSMVECDGCLAFCKSYIFTLSNGNTISMPAGVTLEVSSGFRNPERQERLGSVKNSDHLRGQGVDFALVGSGFDKEVAYYVLWRIFSDNPLPSNIAGRFALEIGVNKSMRVYKNGDSAGPYWESKDDANNGIADRYSDANNLHFQK